jgi:hypothetical protein
MKALCLVDQLVPGGWFRGALRVGSREMPSGETSSCPRSAVRDICEHMFAYVSVSAKSPRSSPTRCAQRQVSGVTKNPVHRPEQLPADYPRFLAEVKARIAAARTRAALAVNSERRFATIWPDQEKVQPLAAQIGWTHHRVLIVIRIYQELSGLLDTGRSGGGQANCLRRWLTRRCEIALPG